MRALIRHPRWAVLLIAAIGFAGVALVAIRGLHKDYRLEAFVAGDSDAYAEFRALMEEFASNELALIAVRNREAANGTPLPTVSEVVGRVRGAIPKDRIDSITALSEVPWYLRLLLGDALLAQPLVHGNLVSSDKSTMSIVLQMKGEGTSGTGRRETVAALKQVVERARADHPETDILLAGPYVTLIDMYEYVDKDLVAFSLAAFSLLAITLFAVFRRWRPMAYAMGVSLVALATALGVAAGLHLSVSLIVQMVVILAVVLTVANAVHLAVRSEEDAEHAAAGPSPSARGEIAVRTCRHRAAPCTAVILATVAGFISVTISRISPVRLFGWLMVIGLLAGLFYALAAIATVTPPGGGGFRSHGRLEEHLRRLGAWSLRRSTLVFALFAVATMLIAVGASRLRLESDFVKNFRAGSEVRRSYEFIEQHLTPLGAFEIVIRARDGSDVATSHNTALADAFGREMVERYGPVKRAMSLADMLRLDPGPAAENVNWQLRRVIARMVLGNDALRNFINTDRSAMRINFRAVEGVEVGAKIRMVEEIAAAAREQFGPEVTVTPTGLYYFYAILVEGLVQDQYRSIAITLPLVVLCIAVLLGSMRIALLSMIPNLMPVACCLGAMGWCDIPINTTTVMMLSVVLGIAVDDTLHYLWRCRAEFRACGDYGAAIRATQGSVGRACTFTTVVIAGGFWILVLSRFLPTAYFGGLVGFTMICALAADLVLLPVLIHRFQPFGRAVPTTGTQPAAGHSSKTVPVSVEGE